MTENKQHSNGSIEKSAEVLKDVSKEDATHSKIKQEETLQAIQMQQFSGPLPPPSILREYASMIDNAPERFFKLVENESEHRHSLEKQAFKAKISYDQRGQWFAFFLAVSIVTIGAIAIFRGHTIPGSITLGISAVGLAGVFIRGKGSASNSSSKKDKE